MAKEVVMGKETENEKKKNSWVCNKFGHKWKKVPDKNYKYHTFVCERCGATQMINQQKQFKKANNFAFFIFLKKYDIINYNKNKEVNNYVN